MEIKQVKIEELKEVPNNKTQLICNTCNIPFKSRHTCKTRIPQYCSSNCYGKSLIGKKTKSNTVFKKGCAPWNKGLTKKEDNRLLEQGKKISSNLQRAENISKAMKGKPLSPTHRNKLSEVKKGKPIKHLIDNWEVICQKISLAEKGVPRPYQQGKHHGNWLGGLTPKHTKIRNSLDYANWRTGVFERDDYTCQECEVRGGKLNAHHILPFSQFPDLRLNIDNGKTLCEPCHKIIPTN